MSKKTELADVPAHGNAGRTHFAGSSPRTRIHIPGADEDDEDSEPTPPVVGWLTVIDGPGKGRSREITFGMNSIGRGDDNAVVLDFDDAKISSRNHFRITYDSVNRMFLVSAGDGQNPVYIDRRPVIDAREIASGTDLTVGASTLRFTALCGADWCWSQDQD